MCPYAYGKLGGKANVWTFKFLCKVKDSTHDFTQLCIQCIGKASLENENESKTISGFLFPGVMN
jgi:hypothetical protein